MHISRYAINLSSIAARSACSMSRTRSASSSTPTETNQIVTHTKHWHGTLGRRNIAVNHKSRHWQHRKILDASERNSERKHTDCAQKAFDFLQPAVDTERDIPPYGNDPSGLCSESARTNRVACGESDRLATSAWDAKRDSDILDAVGAALRQPAIGRARGVLCDVGE